MDVITEIGGVVAALLGDVTVIKRAGVAGIVDKGAGIRGPAADCDSTGRQCNSAETSHFPPPKEFKNPPRSGLLAQHTVYGLIARSIADFRYLNFCD